MWNDQRSIEEAKALHAQAGEMIIATSLNRVNPTWSLPMLKWLQKHEPEEYTPGAAFQSDADLVKAAGNIGTTIFHPVGTCKMGLASDPLAVVDSELRVRGIDRLRVIDASVMPTLTSGNTNAPTIMIAERGSALLNAR